MTNATRIFEANLQMLLTDRDGEGAVERLVRDDPRARFAHAFNLAMEAVDGRHIARAYRQPQAVLTRLVRAGTVADVPHLFQLMAAVLARTGLHFRVLAYHRANPRLRGGRKCTADGENAAAPPPLFVRGSFDLGRVPERTVEPAPAERRERFRTLLQVARELGRVRWRVLRAVRHFARADGSRYGAFRAAARLAIVDSSGRLTGLRSVHAVVSGTDPVPTATVRLVRRLYASAEACLNARRSGEMG